MSPAACCSHSHNWRLVAPWYRWARVGETGSGPSGRGLRPALHKYGDTDFVGRFLADPQVSLAFDDDTDRVQQLESLTSTPLPGDLRKRFLSTRSSVPGPTRKLFQPAHQRFYLVAVGLNCDVPGFPRVDPAAVHATGFVIRRHRVTLPEGEKATAAKLLRELAEARAVAQTQQTYDVAREQRRRMHTFRPAGVRAGDAAMAATRRLEVLRRVETARRRLRVWAGQAGVERRTEGWIPSGEGRFGAWVPIEETPEELVERSYPLRLLSAPPGDSEHAAALGTLYWGLVPTAGDEVAADGAARFAPGYEYEIRAWTREECGGCPGPLVWSEPSESYGLASFHDPAGCAQRPIEITLPDLRELEGSTATPSVRVSSPPGSALSVPQSSDLPEEGSGTVNPNEQICYFSISLFTIVAFFLFNLFLPILLLAFGLWWMLKLKFCLPPSIELEGKLSAELDVVEGGISASAGIDIDILPGLDQKKITDFLRAGLNGTLVVPPAPPGGLPDGMDLGTILTTLYTNDPILELLAEQGYAEPVGAGPIFKPSAVYTVPVARDQVIHP
ncbi:hypothetical protein [Actinoplanes sp. M2I2]|uniref:hypothetical protein n=1 Tax=Actinoplanes sp. M2I2 TaxID=1734444 RepID=UPI0020211481|nr:hypothetical protein [Actinoplanes sp. M2I2]